MVTSSYTATKAAMFLFPDLGRPSSTPRSKVMLLTTGGVSMVGSWGDGVGLSRGTRWQATTPRST